MKCPYCQHPDTQVLETREVDDRLSIRRRRRCELCDRRFTTYERVEMVQPYVVKRDGSQELFDLQKLRASLLLALRKRHISSDQIDTALKNIQEIVYLSAEKGVSSKVLGELVMAELRKIDPVAYIRFASVYRDFQVPEEFNLALSELKAQK